MQQYSSQVFPTLKIAQCDRNYSILITLGEKLIRNESNTDASFETTREISHRSKHIILLNEKNKTTTLSDIKRIKSE